VERKVLQKTVNLLEETEKVVQPIVERVTEEARETELRMPILPFFLLTV
jgi:hypothetical protein